MASIGPGIESGLNLGRRLWRRYVELPGVIPLPRMLQRSRSMGLVGMDRLPLLTGIWRRWRPGETPQIKETSKGSGGLPDVVALKSEYGTSPFLQKSGSASEIYTGKMGQGKSGPIDSKDSSPAITQREVLDPGADAGTNTSLTPGSPRIPIIQDMPLRPMISADSGRGNRLSKMPATARAGELGIPIFQRLMIHRAENFLQPQALSITELRSEGGRPGSSPPEIKTNERVAEEINRAFPYDPSSPAGQTADILTARAPRNAGNKGSEITPPVQPLRASPLSFPALPNRPVAPGAPASLQARFEVGAMEDQISQTGDRSSHPSNWGGSGPEASGTGQIVDLEDLTEKILRRLMRLFSTEGERRGWRRWP